MTSSTHTPGRPPDTAPGEVRRVGLLGGTFDPPHVGHLVVAECARVALGLDEVRLLVAGRPWTKTPVASAEQRLELAGLAADGDEHLHVDGREVHREGPTYTADTLDELAREEPATDWFFLLGADAAAELDRWVRVEDVLRAARLVVVDRDGVDRDRVGETRVDWLRVPRLDVSSTDLRRRYQAGDATRHLVPLAVDRRIRALGLYGARP